MPRYFITKAPEAQTNFKGEPMGLSERLAVYYLPALGRTRLYRQAYGAPQKNMRLLVFESEKGAKPALDKTNEISGGGWVIEELK